MELRKCSNCNHILKNGERVTLVVPNVEVIGKYRKNREGFNLQVPHDFLISEDTKIYCNKCLDIKKHL